MSERDDEDFASYRRAILGNIERLEVQVKELTDKLADMTTQMAVLQFKVMAGGAVAGFLAVIVTEIIVRRTGL